MTVARLMMLFTLGILPPNLYLIELCHVFDVDPDLATLTWKYESGYGKDVYGDWDEPTGQFLAHGPFQFHPGTWEWLVEQYIDEYGGDPAWKELENRHRFDLAALIFCYGVSSFPASGRDLRFATKSFEFRLTPRTTDQ